jgi:N-acetylmuramoyl-L-alanine amidase
MHSFARSLIVALLVAAAAPVAAQNNVEQLFKEAQEHETALRREIETRGAGAAALPLLKRVRILVSTYEDLARLFPKSAYGDNALWQGGVLSADAFLEFGEAEDRTAALKLLNAIPTAYPSSALVRQVQPLVTKLAGAPARIAEPSRAAAEMPAPVVPDSPEPGPIAPATVEPAPEPAPAPQRASARAPRVATLRAIRHEVLPGALRVTLELDREVAFHEERIDGPPRVFVDLQNTQTTEPLKDTTIPYTDDNGVVQRVRTGRQSATRVRVVLDLEGAGRHSVYALYNPFRVVIDVERRGATKGTETVLATKGTKDTKDGKEVAEAMVARPEPVAPAPVTAKPNVDGSLSLSRQLGLGVSRIVLDPGHGGHDPGAKASGLTEADLVLDIALRVEALLKKEPGVEVVLTRRTDAFIPLEERTAMANREDADLFLSIHVNSHDDARIRGYETYFLNFAQNKQAEAIAARENASATRTISNLPEIVRAITLNNKLDESRDFASHIQTAMTDRLRRARKTSRNLGVKQAPFMVLIGAQMPAALAEVTFLTNKQEQTWLKTELYKRQLAEALFNGIMAYQRALKGAQVASTQ